MYGAATLGKLLFASTLLCAAVIPIATKTAPTTTTATKRQLPLQSGGGGGAAKEPVASGGQVSVARAQDDATHALPLYPSGLLDSSLLSRGSFEFAQPLVRFDTLKVLGNVYVRRINGRPLRQAFVLKRPLHQRNAPASKRTTGSAGEKPQQQQRQQRQSQEPIKLTIIS